MAVDQLGAFMNAISAVESGHNYDARGPYTGSTYGRAIGRYQIMEKIYGAWAKEAGVDPNDYSPAAQDKVARKKMMDYYNRYGSWDLVAVAWFAGPGRADKAKKSGINSVGGIKDMLGTSVSKYVSKVTSGMRSAPANPRQADLAQGVGSASQSPQRPRGQSWLTEGMNAVTDSVVGGGRRSTIAPIEAAPGTVLTAQQEQTRNDQINQETLGSIMSSISEAAKGRGGQVLDAKSFLGLPRSMESSVIDGLPEVESPQAPAPSQPQPETPRQADGPMAEPPKHDGFAGLTASAQTGTQRLMGQFPGLRFTSGFRDEARNAAAGGVKNSKHLTGQASDFVGSEEEMQQAAAWAKSQGAKVLIHDSGSGRHLHIEWA